MFHWASASMKRRMPWLASLLVCGFLVLAFLLVDSRSASALPIPAGKVYAIPAFARKYGMPCSACHEAWPKLNNFGQRRAAYNPRVRSFRHGHPHGRYAGEEH